MTGLVVRLAALGRKAGGCSLIAYLGCLQNEPLRAASSSSWDTAANQRMAVARGVAKGLTG